MAVGRYPSLILLACLLPLAATQFGFPSFSMEMLEKWKEEHPDMSDDDDDNAYGNNDLDADGTTNNNDDDAGGGDDNAADAEPKNVFTRALKELKVGKSDKSKDEVPPDNAVEERGGGGGKKNNDTRVINETRKGDDDDGEDSANKTWVRHHDDVKNNVTRQWAFNKTNTSPNEITGSKKNNNDLVNVTGNDTLIVIHSESEGESAATPAAPGHHDHDHDHHNHSDHHHHEMVNETTTTLVSGSSDETGGMNKTCNNGTVATNAVDDNNNNNSNVTKVIVNGTEATDNDKVYDVTTAIFAGGINKTAGIVDGTHHFNNGTMHE